MELQKTTKVTHYVDVFDLARYLSEKIGLDIEFIDTDNDTDYSVNIKKEPIGEYSMKYVNNTLEKGWISFELGYRAVLIYCANEGWLEEGDYVIQVSW